MEESLWGKPCRIRILEHWRIIRNVVNTNSKYKEDDFTNSDAVDYSQDVCICYRHEARTCPPRSFVPSSPLYTSQPGSQPETLKTITTPSQP